VCRAAMKHGTPDGVRTYPPYAFALGTINMEPPTGSRSPEYPCYKHGTPDGVRALLNTLAINMEPLTGFTRVPNILTINMEPL